jgi:hypothetical protein
MEVEAAPAATESDGTEGFDHRPRLATEEGTLSQGFKTG